MSWSVAHASGSSTAPVSAASVAGGDEAEQADEEQECECLTHTDRGRRHRRRQLHRRRTRVDTPSAEVFNGLLDLAAMEGVPRGTPGRAERSHGLLDPSFSDTSPLHEKAPTSFFRSHEEVLYLPGRLRRLVLLALAALTVSLGLVGNASAQLTPPWCGTRSRTQPRIFLTEPTRPTRSGASRIFRTTRSAARWTASKRRSSATA